MKIIIVSDLHGTKFERVVPKQMWSNASFIISAGDYCQYPYPINTIGIYGNHDTLKEVFDNKTLINCNRNLITFKGLTFFGIEGVFCGEKRFYSNRRKWYHQSHEKVKEYLATAPKCDFFITHERAAGIFDSEKWKKTTGSPEYLEYIKRTQPKFYISGHLCASEEFLMKVNKTVCINPHICGRKSFVVLTLPKGQIEFYSTKAIKNGVPIKRMKETSLLFKANLYKTRKTNTK